MIKLNISITFILIVVTITIVRSITDEQFNEACPNMRKEALKSILQDAHLKKNDDVAAQFFLLTKEHRNPKRIGPGKWTAFYDRFDATKPTVMLITGFWTKNPGLDDWKWELLDYLTDLGSYNVLTVGWGIESNKWEIINTAQYALLAASQIYDFLQNMKVEIEDMRSFSETPKTSNFHVISYGSGVHVSQNLGLILKDDKFWRVKNLLGFNPYRPCFEYTDKNFKIDSNAAEKIYIAGVDNFRYALIGSNILNLMNVHGVMELGEPPEGTNRNEYCLKNFKPPRPDKNFLMRECDHNLHHFYKKAVKCLVYREFVKSSEDCSKFIHYESDRSKKTK